MIEAILSVSLGVLCLICGIVILIVLLKGRSRGITSADLEHMKQEFFEQMRLSRSENSQATQESLKTVSAVLSDAQRQAAELQDKRLLELGERLQASALQTEQKLENMRIAMESRLSTMQQQNEKQLDRMRLTVDEKLQKTLNERISQSFQMVSERLEQVYKGLGEMQTLAVGVGDLKKVLSNVKTRGILGEIQLGAILSEILSPEQYQTNIATKPGSREVVEFAVCLPGDGDVPVYLPIDSKFPADVYQALLDAYDSGDTDRIATCRTNLERNIKQSAKTIHDKYLSPPYTTDFGILFLPFEGLYAEAVKAGLIDILQRDYKINIAGPTTMAAILNSLQMGFRTLAIQKHSSDVWKVLGAVKTEFDKFGDVLSATQTRLEQANRELDKLVGVRTRKIRGALKSITSLSESEADSLLGPDE